MLFVAYKTFILTLDKKYCSVYTNGKHVIITPEYLIKTEKLTSYNDQ